MHGRRTYVVIGYPLLTAEDRIFSILISKRTRQSKVRVSQKETYSVGGCHCWISKTIPASRPKMTEAAWLVMRGGSSNEMAHQNQKRRASIASSHHLRRRRGGELTGDTYNTTLAPTLAPCCTPTSACIPDGLKPRPSLPISWKCLYACLYMVQ